MRSAPDLARVAALLADPARARMLTALMHGKALTATELAIEAGIAPSTASSHLAKLVGSDLLMIERQGRHRYFRLAGSDVATLLEDVESVATTRSLRRRFGPSDPALRVARVCYDHLAGERGVWLLDRLRARNVLGGLDGCSMTADGQSWLSNFGIDLDAVSRSRRTFIRTCLDWSERRHHLGGALGAAILERILELRWARREHDTRALSFSSSGQRSLERLLV